MSRHRRSTRPRAGVPAVLAAGLLVAASACSAAGGVSQDVSTGPGTPSSSNIAFLNQAAAATNEVQTFKVEIATTLDGLGAGGEVTARGTGEIDRAGKRAHLELDASGALDAFGGAGDLVDGAGEVEVVVDGDTAYLRSPLYADLTGSDATWVSASAADLADDGPSAITGQGDPGGLLALLEGAGGPLEERGREDVRGVPTRHVATVIDVEKALAQLPDDRHRAAVDALREYGAEASSYVTIPAEAWVDDDGRVRRLRVDLDFSEAADEAPGLADASASITVELFDFDEPVDIAVPDPADVAELDLSSLLGGD